MNDPHVVSLTYDLMPSEEVSYREPLRVDFDNDLCNGYLDDGVLVLRPKDHYPSASTARKALEPFVRAWELDCWLKGYRGALSFEFREGKLIDRSPESQRASHILQVHSACHIHLTDEVRLHVSRREYPAPPDHFRFTSDVEVLWNRLQGYRSGREPLLSMAYFCLSWIERRVATGRATAAKLLNVDKSVLDKLGDLTSNRGDGTRARKANAKLTPLADIEADWIVAALEALVRNLGEYQSHAPARITMQSLPPCGPATAAS